MMLQDFKNYLLIDSCDIPHTGFVLYVFKNMIWFSLIFIGSFGLTVYTDCILLFFIGIGLMMISGYLIHKDFTEVQPEKGSRSELHFMKFFGFVFRTILISLVVLFIMIGSKWVEDYQISSGSTYSIVAVITAIHFFYILTRSRYTSPG